MPDDDAFDPRTWSSDIPYLPIWLDPSGEMFVVVDREDYAWAIQWTWRIKFDKHGRKVYAYHANGYYENGYRAFTRSIYQHKEICRRAKGSPPTSKHKIGDHENGVSQDCRRDNLRWATPSMNRQNIDGSYARQRRLAL